MTRARKAVLAALAAAESPLNAADIRALLGDGFDQATIYRTLRWLTDQGLAEEFAFACAERGVERYYVDRSKPHGHFFHCESCHRFLPIGACGVEEIERRLETESGYRVDGHTLYFIGRCPDCV